MHSSHQSLSHFMKVASCNSEGGRHEDCPEIRKDTGFPSIRLGSLWGGKWTENAMRMWPPAISFVYCSGRSRQSFWGATISGGKIPLTSVKSNIWLQRNIIWKYFSLLLYGVPYGQSLQIYIEKPKLKSISTLRKKEEKRKLGIIFVLKISILYSKSLEGSLEPVSVTPSLHTNWTQLSFGTSSRALQIKWEFFKLWPLEQKIRQSFLVAAQILLHCPLSLYTSCRKFNVRDLSH